MDVLTPPAVNVFWLKTSGTSCSRLTLGVFLSLRKGHGFRMSADENMARETPVAPGTDRSFGIVFALVFGVVSVVPLWRGGPVRLWALGVAATFLLVALAAPRVLHPLNVAWFHFGMLLHRVTNPVILSVLFFGVVTPTGVLLRLFGKRPLQLHPDPDASTYWVQRTPPPEGSSMARQF